MGVAVPEDFRQEMAMVGDWQVTAQRVVCEELEKEDTDHDVKPEGLNIGVRKRKFDGQEEMEDAGEKVVRKGWGSTTKSYPGSNRDGDDDLDALLKATKPSNTPHGKKGDSKPSTTASQTPPAPLPEASGIETPTIKQEWSLDEPSTAANVADTADAAAIPAIVKQEDGVDPGIRFKKRKSKPIRQK